MNITIRSTTLMLFVITLAITMIILGAGLRVRIANAQASQTSSTDGTRTVRGVEIDYSGR